MAIDVRRVYIEVVTPHKQRFPTSACLKLTEQRCFPIFLRSRILPVFLRGRTGIAMHHAHDERKHHQGSSSPVQQLESGFKEWVRTLRSLQTVPTDVQSEPAETGLIAAERTTETEPARAVSGLETDRNRA